MKEYELSYTVQTALKKEQRMKERFVAPDPLQALKRLRQIFAKDQVLNVNIKSVKRSPPEIDASTVSGNNPPRMHHTAYHLPKGTL